MKILAFDTAAAACSAALWADGAIVAHEWCAMERGHAEALVPMLDRVIGDANYTGLSAIGVTVGPGAFTGLRIALATARGLSLATGVPALGISNFDVVARMAAKVSDRTGTELVVALETKRTDLYLQAFDVSDRPIGKPACVAIEDVAGWLPRGATELAVAGDAGGRLIAALPETIAARQIGDASLPEVMIAVQKASVSFEAVTQVRNKLLSAYQEIMNMQV